MNVADTIVAISSAVGPAARMIVRIAGPEAVRLLRQLALDVVAPSFLSASATRVKLTFAGLDCPAWAYVFIGPRSYTGDDLVEVHIPGNPLLARVLFEVMIASGARSAQAGEFTARAFLNGRLDLAAAEGVALTIAATHDGELRAAGRLRAGELSRRLIEPLDSLTDALALIESNIDFAEEDIVFIDGGEVRHRVETALRSLDDLVAGGATFDCLAGEPSFVLVGLPNAGKSTLLNALAGTERAIVSPVAGTTRDALSAAVALPRGWVRVIDVAGLESGSKDAVDRQMQERARQTIDQADFIIEVCEATNAARAWLGRPADLIVRTKIDLESDMTGEDHPERATPASLASVDRPAVRDAGIGPSQGPIACSALTGTGMSDLYAALDRLAFGGAGLHATLALTARHLNAIDTARDALRRVSAQHDQRSEIVAEELRRAVHALGEVLGRVSPDDVLGRVFAAFCVGK